MILEERARQLSDEGFSSERDSVNYGDGELERAAVCYATPSDYRVLSGDDEGVPVDWPWSAGWWRPSCSPSSHPTPIRDLVKAGALIAAAIDCYLYREANVRVEAASAYKEE